MDYLKRTWAEIDLGAIESNYRAIKALLKPKTKVCCVVKADAYGHGAEMLAKVYESLGADWFAVSNLEEALQLRRAGAEKPILILGYTPPCCAGLLAENNVAQAVVGPEFAAELSREATDAGVIVRTHLQIDTGMSRVGFFYQSPERDAASLDAMERACRLPGLKMEGAFTHFASADEGNGGCSYTKRQFACFTGALRELEQRGISFQIRHCANSAAIFDYPEMQLDMVRPGVILYGLMPSPDVRHPVPLKPAMTLQSMVALVKDIPAGTCVSYGRHFTASQPAAVATVPVGYADGYLRSFGDGGFLVVHGRRAKVIGRVCMDQLMIDITGISGVKAGDKATVFGRTEDGAATADEIAARAGTIGYEVICGIATRVPRVFLRGGKEVGVLDYLQK